MGRPGFFNVTRVELWTQGFAVRVELLAEARDLFIAHGYAMRP